jgi:putative colanic acid biosynthesis acetyltransferase WcaF
MNKTVDLSNFKNPEYQPGPFLKRITWYFVNAFIFDSWIPFYGFKRFLLKCWGAEVGQGVIIKPRVNIKYPWKLKIGDHSWIGEGVWIDNLDMVVIGPHCCISQGALLLCGNHRYDRTSFDLFTQPIHIEEGCWVGAKCIILPGSHLQTHAVIQAGITFHGKSEPFQIYKNATSLIPQKRTVE